jgi:hypothetical protein
MNINVMEIYQNKFLYSKVAPFVSRHNEAFLQGENFNDINWQPNTETCYDMMLAIGFDLDEFPLVFALNQDRNKLFLKNLKTLNSVELVQVPNIEKLRNL